MPTDERIQAMLVKQTRRGIIDLLNLAYPAALDFESICANFMEIDVHYIRRDLTYFCEREMVEWVNPRANAPWAQRK